MYIRVYRHFGFYRDVYAGDYISNMRYKIPRHFGRYCRIIGVVLFVVCSMRVLFEYHSDGTSDRKEMSISNHSNSPYQKSDVPYLVDTETCKIPNINPFDPSVLLYLRQGRKISCNKHLPITYEDGSRLCINWTAIDQSPWRETFGYCRYQAIYRPLNITDHDFYKYLEPSKEFNTSIEMKDDFVRVFCYTNGGGKIYTNYHQFILLKDDVEARCSKSFQKHKNNKDLRETLNVIMIGVDSISRLNFMRYMQKTRSYLLNDLEAVELTGYNKVADNTFVNIVPMTLGKFLEEVPWNEKMNKTPFDNYNFIWKQFGSRGYRTLYAEDAPSIAIFDYLKAGFHKPPTDYFNRHFSVAMTADRKSWYNSHHCLVNKMETEIMLDYVTNFISLHKHSPHLAFAFITGLTHDFLENAGMADEPHLKFLKHLMHSNYLNNSVLFYYSDHGLRFGNVRQLYVGKMEERLPFMFLVFPNWFMKKYPEYANNLRTNSRRLTTPFDIYETLTDILYFKDNILSRQGYKNRGMSLFKEIPKSRTCDNAGILPHWCTCAKYRSLPTSDVIVRNIALFVVSEINRQLFDVSDLCADLSVQKIRTAGMLLQSDKVLRFQDSVNDVINRTVFYGERAKTVVDYQLTLQTHPGGGVFEATVQYNELIGSFKMMTDVSRINKYGHQSDCITSHALKKFCFCIT